MLSKKQLRQRAKAEKAQREEDEYNAGNTGKPETQLPYPHVQNWIPVLDSDGYLDWNQSYGTVVVSPYDEDGTYFDMSSFTDDSLAYYVQPGDPLICRTNKLNETQICLLNKAKIRSWEKNEEEKCWKGTIIIDEREIEFDDSDLSSEIKKDSLKTGDIITFDPNGKFIKNIRLAKPNVLELPEDRRRRIKIKLDKISDGGTVTELCPEIMTWECPYCKVFNLSKDDDGFYAVTCRNKVCGAPRPNPAYSTEERTNNHSTYNLSPVAPKIWTVQMVTAWMNSNNDNKHTTVEEIIFLGNKDYKPEKPKKCSGCQNPLNQNGKGCCSIAIYDVTPQTFEEFYDLKADTTSGKIRRQQMKDVLDKFPPCCCNLLAIPKAPCNVFRNVKGGKLNSEGRKYFDNHSEIVKTAIIKERVVHTKSTLFPSISNLTKDQAMLCHIVPLQAAGCKISTDNIVWRLEMCPLCQNLDKLFTTWQD